MPIYIFKCEECECRFEKLLKLSEMDNKEGIKCPLCDKKNIQRIVTTFGAYTISGDNSASTRPKSGGRK